MPSDPVPTEARIHALEAELADARRRADQADTLLRVAESLASSRLDLDAIVQKVTDEATALTGAKFGAFFYNVIDAHGEAYLLYALSGAPKAAFDRFGLPRNTPIFSPTFTGQGVVRIDDVTKDPRYGTMSPHHGMPKGHLPVVSYLAVPVMLPTGDVLGGIFLGHDQPGRFAPHHEEIVLSIARSASWAIDGARQVRATRHAEEAQRKLVDELTETVRLNELFTGVLAHDLRNPLAGMLSAAQLMQRRGFDGNLDTFKRNLERIVSSGQRMARMIEQLLDVTRIRGGEMPNQPGAVDLLQVVKTVIAELEQSNPEWTIALHHLGDTSGVWDADRLGQVFSNLIGNAVQHGQPEGGIQVRLSGDDEQQVVTVHNRGAIPPEALPMLFEPMSGGHRGEKRKGLGLGLFITREMVKRHGGTVTVESSELNGTTFTVTLPRLAHEPRAAKQPLGTRQVEEARDRVWESDQRTALLVESMREYAIFVIDPNGRVSTWNAGAERIKGYTRDEIVGQHFSVFYPPEDVAAGLPDRLLAAAKQLGSASHEGWRVRKDGSRFWANVTITAIRNRAGEHVGFAKVTRDLTEQKALEEARLRTVQATEGIRLRDEFLSLVSHELKTPLTGLLLQLDMFKQKADALPVDLAVRLDRARQSSLRLAELIDTLVDVSRFSTDGISLLREKFELAPLLRQVVEEFRPQTDRVNVALTITTDGALEGHFDRVRVSQALLNLLSNALKFGSGKPIEVSARPRGEGVVLEVRDHGVGFGDEAMQQLFGRFVRGPSVQHYGGLGLGLHIVREIARAHGGTVSAENVDGGGAVVRLWLPTQPTAARNVES